MSPTPRFDTDHVDLDTLCKYRKSPPDMPDEKFRHVFICDECLHLLSLCGMQRVSKRFKT